MRTSIKFPFLRSICIVLISCFSSLVIAQSNSEISDFYEDYTKAPREIVYMHLNKSSYIKGEQIGFTAYVLNKDDKKPSLLTTNLYVSIEDRNQNIVKQKLIKVQNGIVSNVIDIDSSFTSGHYTIKAYTNWMRNFNEQNYFTESIKIIDPEIENYIEKTSIKNEIYAQFLPEGGHILNSINNTIGVVLKDGKGFGIPNAKGTVTDKNGFLISEFKVNTLGISKFPLIAEYGNNYSITINYLNKEHSFRLNEKIEPIGVTLSVVQHRGKAIVTLITNKESLAFIKNKPYKLAIHNGDMIDAIAISFNEDTTIIKAFDLNTIPSGINIFTLFNEINTPIVERLSFNYNGIDIIKSNHISATKSNDSTAIKLNFKQIDTEKFHNLSISVLPQQTQSYKRHHNMLSYNFLQPYVKGPLENAPYYFSEINEEKKMELDNLLITQGWSSYDWDEIFKNDNKLAYNFEQGISVRANINSKNKISESTYMLQTSSIESPHFFEVTNIAENHFFIDSLFPYRSDLLYLSKFDDNNTLQPTELYFQSKPNIIPQLHSHLDVLLPKSNYELATNLSENLLILEKLNNVQTLDEVIVNADLNNKAIRIKALSKYNSGKITIIDDQEISQHMVLSRFLSTHGFYAVDDYMTSQLHVRYNSKFKPPPIIFLDDSFASIYELYRYSMTLIDYIIIERSGKYGKYEGAIKIYSYPGSRTYDNKQRRQEYKFPLTFNSKKKFYVPKYRYYNDDFYKSYGTIDWKPQLVTDVNCNVSFKIAQPKVPITLFIEGIANDGSFIFEEKTIVLN